MFLIGAHELENPGPCRPRRAEEHSAWGQGGLSTLVLLCSQGQAGTRPSVGQWLPPMPALIITPQLSMGNWARDLGGSHTLWAGGLLSAEAQQAGLAWPGLAWNGPGGVGGSTSLCFWPQVGAGRLKPMRAEKIFWSLA